MINQQILPNYPDIWTQTTNWQPNNKQLELLQQIYLEIIEVNQFLNLTRITEPQDFWEKHIWDSLAPILPLNLTNQKVIDIGTGAGFPGLPVAIAYPEFELTLLDSTRKKINFIDNLITKLKLKNVNTLIGRAEEIVKIKDHQESYDLALIRAVAKPSICADYALPLLKKDGLAILYRGNWDEEETEFLEFILKKLGGEIEKIEKINTPLTQNIRHNIFIRKIKETPLKESPQVGKPILKSSLNKS
jgi:16S rRNA (guanine527-N7)-methyltransferase